jgi:hypothetical protein
MPRKRHKPEEIVAKLRQVDVLVSQGQSVADERGVRAHHVVVAPPALDQYPSGDGRLVRVPRIGRMAAPTGLAGGR